MDIQTLKEYIADLPDDMPVIVEIDNGFISACATDSNVVTLPTGQEAFYLAPCFCPYKGEEFEFGAEDFPINEN